MRNHTKVYLSKMKYDETDFIPCEVCGTSAVDIHHIDARGMGGSKAKDTIENLMALCRMCHNKFGDKKQFMELLGDIHKKQMSKRL